MNSAKKRAASIDICEDFEDKTKKKNKRQKRQLKETNRHFKRDRERASNGTVDSLKQVHSSGEIAARDKQTGRGVLF